jgi:hypothetical protein
VAGRCAAGSLACSSAPLHDVREARSIGLEVAQGEEHDPAVAAGIGPPRRPSCRRALTGPPPVGGIARLAVGIADRPWASLRR